VSGGDEPKCISEAESQRWQQRAGRPCPRVDLDGRNLEPLQLIGWTIHDNLKPMAGEYVRAKLHGRPAAERAAILERLAAFHRDKRVSAVLYPDPDPTR
jgi:hypothetical protein